MKRFAFIILFAITFTGTLFAQQPESAEPATDSVRVSTPGPDISALAEWEFMTFLREKRPDIRLDEPPLFVVNGKPIYPLTPDNIEYLMGINIDRMNAFSILKPDTAIGIWGERAANGVVTIELMPERFEISIEKDAEYAENKELSAKIRMFDWVSSHLEYPQWAYERMIELTVPVTFDVETDGTISNANCEISLRDVPEQLMPLIDVAIRTVAAAPKWDPVPETRTYTIPVEFDMPDFAPDTKPMFLWEGENETEEEIYEFQDRLERWLSSQITIPEDFKISLSFIIEKFGSVSNVKVISTSDEGVAADVVAILERSQEWLPGYDKDGLPVRAFLYSRLIFDDNGEKGIEMGKGEDDVMPLFNGSDDLNVFRNWVMMKLSYPHYAQEEGIQGRVMLLFQVEKDGEVVIKEIIHSPNELLTKEVLRVVKKSPKWMPGYRNGKLIRVYYILPTDFLLQ